MRKPKCAQFFGWSSQIGRKNTFLGQNTSWIWAVQIMHFMYTMPSLYRCLAHLWVIFQDFSCIYWYTAPFQEHFPPAYIQHLHWNLFKFFNGWAMDNKMYKVFFYWFPIPRNTQIIPIGNATLVKNTIFYKVFWRGNYNAGGEQGVTKGGPLSCFCASFTLKYGSEWYFWLTHTLMECSRALKLPWNSCFKTISAH